MGKRNGNTSLFLDLFVIVLCLSVAAISLNLFRLDLSQTIESQNAEPVGTVTVKYNVVQRRVTDRVLWDRLNNESYVYSGDIIRIAERSEAALHIGSLTMDLTENTLIRIQVDNDLSQFELFSGEVNLDTGTADEGPVIMFVGIGEIKAGAGTVFKAASHDGSMELQVSEGTVLLTAGGQSREATAGTVISLDADGTEIIEPAVIVRQPQPNAHYLKSGPEPVKINFALNRVNMGSGEALRLVVAGDRGFSRVVDDIPIFENTETALDAGSWFWQILHDGKALGNGRITVVNASGPALYTPARDHVFSYRSKQPEICFRWSDVAGATYYLLEAGATPNLENPLISKEVMGTSLINSSLGLGTWYWRVRPAFPPLFQGRAGVSSVMSFRIEHNEELETLVLRSPPPGGTVNAAANNGHVYLSWGLNNEAVSYTVQLASNQDLQNPIITQTVQDNFYVYGRHEQGLEPGLYYWGVFYTNIEGTRSPVSRVRSFAVVSNEMEKPILPDSVIAEPPPPIPEPELPVADAEEPDVETPDIAGTVPAVDPPHTISEESLIPDHAPLEHVTLVEPPTGTAIAGLVAREQSTLFRWNSTETVGRSRFILSRNSNPAAGQPEREIANPPFSIRLDNLGEGVWYWTVEAWTPEGNDISARTPAKIQVLPIPPPPPANTGLLPEAANRRPVNGNRVRVNVQGMRRSMVFDWWEVSGANAYIFSLFYDGENGREEIVTSNPSSRNFWTLPDNRILKKGTFFWQVEAVNMNEDGTIGQRGRIGENFFIVDVPVIDPAPVEPAADAPSP